MLHDMDGRWPQCYGTWMVGGHLLSMSCNTVATVLHDMDGR